MGISLKVVNVYHMLLEVTLPFIVEVVFIDLATEKKMYERRYNVYKSNGKKKQQLQLGTNGREDGAWTEQKDGQPYLLRTWQNGLIGHMEN